MLEKIFISFPHLKAKVKKTSFQYQHRIFQKKETKEIEKQTKKNNQLHRFDPKYKRLEEEAKTLLAEVSCEETREALISIFIQLRQD